MKARPSESPRESGAWVHRPELVSRQSHDPPQDEFSDVILAFPDQDDIYVPALRGVLGYRQGAAKAKCRARLRLVTVNNRTRKKELSDFDFALETIHVKAAIAPSPALCSPTLDRKISQPDTCLGFQKPQLDRDQLFRNRHRHQSADKSKRAMDRRRAHQGRAMVQGPPTTHPAAPQPVSGRGEFVHGPQRQLLSRRSRASMRSGNRDRGTQV